MHFAKRLAAYQFPIDQWDCFYMIGPRGMKGTAELGVDGGVGIKLQNAFKSGNRNSAVCPSQHP